MQLNLVLSAATTAVGIFCGYVVGYFTRRELKPGMKYFSMMQKIIILLIVALSSYYNFWISATASMTALALIIRSGFVKKTPCIKFYTIAYALFGVVFAQSFGTDAFILSASLMFAFGLPSGSLLVLSRKNWAKLLIPFAVFTATASISGIWLHL